MASEPRTVKGPCYRCEGNCWCCRCGCDEVCMCHHNPKYVESTEPNPKLEPEDLRPNVPPRMM